MNKTQYLMYRIYLLPSTQQTICCNGFYNDMFRLTRVIVRLCSEHNGMDTLKIKLQYLMLMHVIHSVTILLLNGKGVWASCYFIIHSIGQHFCLCQVLCQRIHSLLYEQNK
jgi:hypothetical protein